MVDFFRNWIFLRTKSLCCNAYYLFTFQGVLRIEVVEAEELIAKDINVFSKNTSDPYVVLNGKFTNRPLAILKENLDRTRFHHIL